MCHGPKMLPSSKPLHHYGKTHLFLFNGKILLYISMANISIALTNITVEKHMFFIHRNSVFFANVIAC